MISPAPDHRPSESASGKLPGDFLAIALGSNLGDRSDYLQQARLRLEQLIAPVARQSRIYETDPVGPGKQGLYLNQVLGFETVLEPEELITITSGIEKEMGRLREKQWGPRTIDLDLLLYGSRVLATTILTLPHPRLHERPFVLVPLLEVLPDWQHPLTGQTVAEMRAVQGDEGVKPWQQSPVEAEE